MSNLLYSTLTDKDFDGNPPQVGEPNTYIRNLLFKEVPRNDSSNLPNQLNWQFILNKGYLKKKSKQIRNKKNFLTRNERKKLNILKLPKTGWDYESLSGIREMWKQYMKQNLELTGPAPTCSDPDWNNLSIILAKSELIGSEVEVVRAKCPSHVGLSGTLVLETKMTFQIVTPQSQFKIIPKNTSVFQFILDNLKFTIFGKHIMTKPSERSVKKIKSQMLPDL